MGPFDFFKRALPVIVPVYQSGFIFFSKDPIPVEPERDHFQCGMSFRKGVVSLQRLHPSGMSPARWCYCRQH